MNFSIKGLCRYPLLRPHYIHRCPLYSGTLKFSTYKGTKVSTRISEKDWSSKQYWDEFYKSRVDSGDAIKGVSDDTEVFDWFNDYTDEISSNLRSTILKYVDNQNVSAFIYTYIHIYTYVNVYMRIYQ